MRNKQLLKPNYDIIKKLIEDIVNMPIEEFRITYNDVMYQYDATGDGFIKGNHISIYEFMYLLKEWALEKGYGLQSGISNEGGHCNTMPLFWGELNTGYYGITIEGKTEVDAVLRACIFIYSVKKETECP